MGTAHDLFDWSAVEHGFTEHIRGILTIALGAPELLNETFPEFSNPEIPLEEALGVFIARCATVIEASTRDEVPYLLAETILPWIGFLRNGGFHPVPVLAVHHFLAVTDLPSISDEAVTIAARVEMEFVLQEDEGRLAVEARQ